MNIFAGGFFVKMKQSKIISHIALWAALYLFWIIVFQNRSFTFSRTMTVEFCYLFFIAGNFYFSTTYTIPRYLYRQQYILFGLVFLSGIVATAILRVPLATYLNLHFFIPGRPQPGIQQLFLNSFTNIFIWSICLVTIKLIIDRMRLQQYIADIQKEKSKTELDFLKAQFNPHFLFNSINAIYGHIDKKNGAARHMLLTFSEMLRYQLYECNTESISIEKELHFIKNYIALQQSRKEESLIVRFQVADSIRGFTIAPLLFIAFIENSFKYVSDEEGTENRIEISFTGTGDNLVFRTFNTSEPVQRTVITHKGIGIANVRRRLELLYPGRHQLLIEEKDQTHEVILKLKLS
jgi:two-component system LytT family sensor kinase